MANIDIEGLLKELPNDGRIPKTKIVCTLGPASRSVGMIEKLLKAGMNVAGFNFSHGTHEYHQETLNNLRLAMQNTQIMCACLIPRGLIPLLAEGSAKATDAESTEVILEAALKSATAKGLCAWRCCGSTPSDWLCLCYQDLHRQVIFLEKNRNHFWIWVPNLLYLRSIQDVIVLGA